MRVDVERGRTAMVVSGHHLASFEAANVLRDGGNAVDAAVCAGTVLATVCPDACGWGGDVFMLIYDAASGALHGLNGSGTSPAAARREAYGDGIPLAGLRAAAVPGMVAGWQAALERFGTRRLVELLEPALNYAAAGFPVYPNLARNFASMAETLSADDGARALYLPQGHTPRRGDILRQTELAVAIRQIAEQGIGALYGGELAEAIVAYSATHGGLFSVDDFASYEPLWQEPMLAPFCGMAVATMPPNSYGLTLLLQLAVLQAGGIADLEPGSAEMLRRGMQARQRAYIDALRVIADPTLVEQPARALLEATLKAPQAGMQITPGAGGSLRAAPPGVGGSDTSNVVVMDSQGNAVSLIQRVFHYFGSCVVPSGTGIVLNNRMLGFQLDDEHPNCLAPRRRPAHTLTPVLVLGENHTPVLVCGTPGGPGQTATLAQFLTRVLACGEEVGEAIGAPRWSVTLDGEFVIEAAVAGEVLDELQQYDGGPRVVPAGGQPFGSLMAVRNTGAAFIGAADGRRDASTCGW